MYILVKHLKSFLRKAGCKYMQILFFFAFRLHHSQIFLGQQKDPSDYFLAVMPFLHWHILSIEGGEDKQAVKGTMCFLFPPLHF